MIRCSSSESQQRSVYIRSTVVVCLLPKLGSRNSFNNSSTDFSSKRAKRHILSKSRALSLSVTVTWSSATLLEGRRASSSAKSAKNALTLFLCRWQCLSIASFSFLVTVVTRYWRRGAPAVSRAELRRSTSITAFPRLVGFPIPRLSCCELCMLALLTVSHCLKRIYQSHQ